MVVRLKFYGRQVIVICQEEQEVWGLVTHKDMNPEQLVIVTWLSCNETKVKGDSISSYSANLEIS
jgi:hypothetical protein